MPRFPFHDAVLLLALSVPPSFSYAPSALSPGFGRTRSELQAAPGRLEENAGGMLYVNDRCINCAACSNFAPSVFERNEDIYKHVVYRQPKLERSEELASARAALSACPVAAIRVENDVHGVEGGRDIKDALSIRGDRPFPLPLCPMKSADGEEVDIGVYYLGHHNDASFGAIPYLILGKSPEGENISVMVDVPRFSPSAVRAVKSLSMAGPDYMFLTHVDDTADHNKWKEEFPTLKRIFHSGDLGKHNWVGDLTLENVEVLLREQEQSGFKEELTAWDLNGSCRSIGGSDQKQPHTGRGDFLILHTPGHSPGSISLLFRPKPCPPHLKGSCFLSPGGKRAKYPVGVLFSGDTYAWTSRDGGHMSGFPRYGNDLGIQAVTLQKLGKLSSMWDIIAPGHGHPRFYLEWDQVGSVDWDEMKSIEMNHALAELALYY